jgi:hypothetical protein
MVFVMEEYSISLFDVMQAELSEILEGPGDFIQRLQQCYETAQRYWISLQIKMVAQGFGSAEEEIRFFKEVKPLFTSEIEYYNLVYRLEFFKPVGRSELAAHIQKEQSRLQSFIDSNRQFYQYYKSGQTHLDKNYFLRSAKVDQTLFSHKSSLDPAAYTSHDQLVSNLLTLEKYDCYLRSNYSM